MNIQEAVQTAMASNKAITRGVFRGFFRVIPTNQPECCYAQFKQGTLCPRWQPRAEDLMADDWEIVSDQELSTGELNRIRLENGIATPNSIRAEYGLQPVEGGDMLYRRSDGKEGTYALDTQGRA